MATKKIERDWEKIELDYRAGIKTIRGIAAEHGITHGAVNKRAKRDGWVRDLKAKIKAKANELVSRQQVSKAVSKKRKATEKQVVEANATVQADIILAHRTDIPRKRNLVAKLFAELEALADDQDIIEQMTLALRSGDLGLLSKAADKVISLPVRIKGTVDLVGAYKTLIEMERKVFGIDEKTNEEAVEDFSKLSREMLEKIAQGS